MHLYVVVGHVCPLHVVLVGHLVDRVGPVVQQQSQQPQLELRAPFFRALSDLLGPKNEFLKFNFFRGRF